MLIYTSRWRAVLATVVLLVAGFCDAQSTTTSSTSSVNDLEDTAFIGYYVQPTTVQRLTAGEGKSWVTSATYAADCSGTSSCSFPTGCGSNTLTYGNGDEQDCGTGASCVAFTIFQTSPYGLPSAMNYGCRIGWSAFTVYRANPATATSTSASSSSSASTTSTLSSSEASITAESLTTATTQLGTATSTPAGNASAGSESNAWIAGAVVGPIAGIALIGLAAWLLLRKKKKYEPVVAATGAEAQQPQYSQGNSPQVAEMGVGYKPWPQEMPAHQEPAELPSQRWY